MWWEDADTVVKIVQYCHDQPNIIFRGVYAHCGNSYSGQVDSVRTSSMEAILSLVTRLESEGLECETWGIGSTPSCSSDSGMFSSMTEIHPGNYVMYDGQQVDLGSCSLAQVSVGQ